MVIDPVETCLREFYENLLSKRSCGKNITQLIRRPLNPIAKGDLGSGEDIVHALKKYEQASRAREFTSTALFGTLVDNIGVL